MYKSDLDKEDEFVIEADPKVSLDAICEQMGKTPHWGKGLLLRADGYTTLLTVFTVDMFQYKNYGLS